jgi:hypothetical protein
MAELKAGNWYKIDGSQSSSMFKISQTYGGSTGKPMMGDIVMLAADGIQLTTQDTDEAIGIVNSLHINDGLISVAVKGQVLVTTQAGIAIGSRVNGTLTKITALDGFDVLLK